MHKSRCLIVLVITCCSIVLAQGQIKRTAIKTDKLNFGAGGTVSITGAPVGSIKVTGSNRNEVEITAEIELTGASEADLAALSEVTGFVTGESLGRTSIITYGTHNKLGPKDLWKKFPKKLLNRPLRIDYTISVPRYCDLEIDGGNGDLEVTGVEGAMRINFLETRARVEVIGGVITATFGSGTAEVGFGTRGWRSRAANIQMSRGDLLVKLPSSASADIDALILNQGGITNDLTDQLKPRDRKAAFTERAVIARSGVGGSQMKFTVAYGTIKLARLTTPF